MRGKTVKLCALTALIAACGSAAAVDPDLFDGRVAGGGAASPPGAAPGTTAPEGTVSGSSAGGGDAGDAPRDVSQIGSVGGGAPVQSGSSKRGAEGQSAAAGGSTAGTPVKGSGSKIGSMEAGTSAAASNSAGAGNATGLEAGSAETDGTAGTAARDFEDFGIGGVTPGEMVPVQRSKQGAASGTSAVGGQSPGTPTNSQGSAGAAGTSAPTPSGSGDYGSELPKGL